MSIKKWFFRKKSARRSTVLEMVMKEKGKGRPERAFETGIRPNSFQGWALLKHFKAARLCS